MNSTEPFATFSTIDQKPLSERIIERMLGLISERKLKPGDRLPPETELAAMLNVSRPSLREALRALSVMKVVEIRQGSGTYVTSLQPELLVEHLDFVFSLDVSTFLQLLQARSVIEPGISEIAASHITDEEIAGLEALVTQSEHSRDDPHAFMMADAELHRLIANASRNPILIRFMESIGRLGLASRRRTTQLPGVVDQVLDDHRAIIQALKARDPLAAREAMRHHLETIQNRLERAMDEPGEE